MIKEEYDLAQLITCLKQEKEYLLLHNKQLENPNLIGEDRELVIIYRDSNIAAIERFKEDLSQYIQNIQKEGIVWTLKLSELIKEALSLIQAQDTKYLAQLGY